MPNLESNTGLVEYTAQDEITALREELTDIVEKTSYKDKTGKVDKERNKKKKEEIKTYSYKGLTDLKTMLEEINNKDLYVLLSEEIPGSNSQLKDNHIQEEKVEEKAAEKADGKKITPWNKAIEKIFQNSELVPDLNNFTKEQVKTILEIFADKPYSKIFWRTDEAYVLTLATQYVLGIEIDGKSGGKTLNSIKKFQKTSHLKPDGAVGPETIKAMLDTLK